MWRRSDVFFFVLSFFLQAAAQNRQFVLVETPMTWLDAQTYCKKNHVDLAVFQSLLELEALQSKYSALKDVWIGLHADDPLIWTWTNGEKISFENWLKGEPSNLKEKCGRLQGIQWLDTLCDTKHQFLCYDEDNNNDDNDGVMFVTEKKTWEKALEHCRALQTDPTVNSTVQNHLYDLPHVTNNLLDKDLIQFGRIQEVWIGLRFLAGLWFWVDGFPLEEQLKKQLDVCPAPMMHCGTLSVTGDQPLLRNCSEKKNFFCFEKNMLL